MVLLAFFWARIKEEIHPFWDMNAVMVGIAVFILWIGLEGRYPQIGSPAGFNPYDSGLDMYTIALMGFCLFGAALVVPVIEELFWRSFALRFLMDNNIKRFPLASFLTLPIFLKLS